MSGPSLLEPQFSRLDSDPPWEHWARCALRECGEPIDPDELVMRHGAEVHNACADAYCDDCEPCEEERQAEAAESAAERAREK